MEVPSGVKVKKGKEVNFYSPYQLLTDKGDDFMSNTSILEQLNKQSTITLIKELDVTDLAGEKVMIDFSTGKYFLLKGVANDIWDYIQSPITVGTIVDNLLAEYEVDEATCYKSVLEFLTQLYSNEFISVKS